VIGSTDDFHYMTSLLLEKSIGRSRKHKHYITTLSSLLMALPAAKLRRVLAGLGK